MQRELNKQVLAITIGAHSDCGGGNNSPLEGASGGREISAG